MTLKRAAGSTGPRPAAPGAPAAGTEPRPTRVLVVDDSAVMRQFMAALVGSQPDLVATTAADPILALAKIERERPDVILLDLEMPRMDGLAFLRRLMRDDPIPVVVCSSHAQSGTAAAFAALDLGALEVVAKPAFGLRAFLEESAESLLETLRGASQARLPGRRRDPATAPMTGPASGSATGPIRPAAREPGPVRVPIAVPRSAIPIPNRPPGSPPWPRLVAIGASTGGPEALRVLLGALPEDSPALLIVQHMPRAFTGAFARRLDQICAIEVAEATDGAEVLASRALIAPGDCHLVLVREGGRLAVRLSAEPLVNHHRPSVDVLFSSVAEVAGAAAVGVLLTGMGADGAAGLLAMRQAGARTLAQDEASSVVYGMPREALAKGAVEEVVPIDRLAGRLLDVALDFGNRTMARSRQI
ncbi:MAG: chemotaxis response regulator protein-glutamate methylesterase [Acidobacteriota bacterium]